MSDGGLGGAVFGEEIGGILSFRGGEWARKKSRPDETPSVHRLRAVSGKGGYGLSKVV